MQKQKKPCLKGDNRNYVIIMLLIDELIIAFSMVLACVFAFNFNYGLLFGQFWINIVQGIIILAVIYAVAFYGCGLHKIMWQYAGFIDVFKLVLAVLFTCMLSYTIHRQTSHRFDLNVYFITVFTAMVLLLGLRMMMRSKRRIYTSEKGPDLTGHVMIIGAGSAGAMLIHDIKNNIPSKKCCVMCIIDDNPMKQDKYIYGVRVVGGRETIPAYVKNYKIDTIIFAIPACSQKDKYEILNICSSTHCKIMTLPGINQIVDGKVNVSVIRAVEIEELLGRPPIRLNLEGACDYIRDRVVLITGGGGSIGSELCRQVAQQRPKKLIIFDIYENNAYDILNELKNKFPALDVLALIGSVRDISRLDSVFEEYRPEIIYHAAAHKHVPLMEDSPCEAVKNNVFGTLNTVVMADKYKARRFVLISTDKAVNPTNVMGATKRICEMIVQSYNNYSETEFSAVRFGNVLGSNGSVIPLFKEQIKNGGPVTVTHPDIIRYFMTIPEAVSLVIQAGAAAIGGEIFVLDMGKPVKILELAENLIRLSGFEPYRDIDIRFTGLRPGEKLYEELLMDEEGIKATENELIHIGRPIDIDENTFFLKLAKLKSAAFGEASDIRSYVMDIVTTYKAN